MVAYILFDPALHMLIKEEVRPAVKPYGVNTHFLVDSCPQLRSVFHEAMRLTKRDIGIRKIEKPTLLGGKLLSSGNAVILATCQLHENRDVFGHNVHKFDPNRFLERPELSRSSSFKPFGGGRTYCPGRVFAMQEIFSFIAFLFHHWDIELTSIVGEDKRSNGKQKFPVADDSTITLGITRPLPGQDVWIKLAYNGS